MLVYCNGLYLSGLLHSVPPSVLTPWISERGGHQRGVVSPTEFYNIVQSSAKVAKSMELGWKHAYAKSLQSCPTLCKAMDCSPPGSSVHGILQARILEWVAMPSCRGSYWPRVQTCISCGSCIAGRFFTAEPLGTGTGSMCLLIPILVLVSWKIRKRSLTCLSTWRLIKRNFLGCVCVCGSLFTWNIIDRLY